jgi:hypothetical protein
MSITTNNQPRDLLGFWDFSDKDQRTIRKEFDWMDDVEFENGFFKYKGWIYHLSEFTRDGVERWDGSNGQSWSCGVLIKLTSDCEQVICGWWSA